MSTASQRRPNDTLPTININQIKTRLSKTWSDGDYAHFAKFMENGAIEVLDGWGIPKHSDMLDVGCGVGQTAIPAARMGVNVTGIDIAPNLVQAAKERAFKENLTANFDVGDAEDLPYGSSQFDSIISMFGAMFAPRPEFVVQEFARVLRSGGKLYMANWTSNSMPARMFKSVAEVTPPPAGSVAPVLWGSEDIVRERLDEAFTDIQLTRKIYPQWQYPFDAAELVQLFREYFGPVKRAFDASDEAGQMALFEKLVNTYRENSQYENGILTITGGEYLEVIATRR